jgi:hypothetical protein
MARFLAPANPGRGTLARCILLSPCSKGTGCWMFHVGVDCEAYVRGGACSGSCGLQHQAIRREYYARQVPRATAPPTSPN